VGYGIYRSQYIVSVSTGRRWYEHSDNTPNAGNKGAMHKMGCIGEINSAFAFFGIL
jgi:hypothetical protein